MSAARKRWGIRQLGGAVAKHRVLFASDCADIESMLHALEIRNGRRAPSLWCSDLPPFEDAAELADWRNAVSELQPELIMIDVPAGHDAAHFMTEICALRDALGCAVICVH